jgi:hypothetical protein
MGVDHFLDRIESLSRAGDQEPEEQPPATESDVPEGGDHLAATQS